MLKANHLRQICDHASRASSWQQLNQIIDVEAIHKIQVTILRMVESINNVVKLLILEKKDGPK